MSWNEPEMSGNRGKWAQMSLNESKWAQMSLNKRKSGQMSLNCSIFESASTR